LQGLAENGFGGEQLAEMQKIIDAEKSDLFDVLAYVAYALPTLSREERATNAKGAIYKRFNAKQQAFLDFVLTQHVKVGVQELDVDKLSPLLKLRYKNAIADAIADPKKSGRSSRVFSGISTKLLRRRENGASHSQHPARSSPPRKTTCVLRICTWRGHG